MGQAKSATAGATVPEPPRQGRLGQTRLISHPQPLRHPRPASVGDGKITRTSARTSRASSSRHTSALATMSRARPLLEPLPPLTPRRTRDSAPARSGAPPTSARGAREWRRSPRGLRCQRRSPGDHHTGRPGHPPGKCDEEGEPSRASRKEASARHPRGFSDGRSARRSRRRGPARATSPRRPRRTVTRRPAPPSSSFASSFCARAASSSARLVLPQDHSAPRPRATTSAAQTRRTGAVAGSEEAESDSIFAPKIAPASSRGASRRCALACGADRQCGHPAGAKGAPG